jgi:GNAT superfamily N-acetyltransferase
MPLRAPVPTREMVGPDIPAGLALCRASGWNQTERDWQHFLDVAPHGALVALENSSVVGTVATLPYGPFTWISMVLVDPAARGKGIGTLLLQQGLALVPVGSAARLDATPAGEVLYRKLGFVPEYGLARLFLEAGRRRDPRSPGARPLVHDDWLKIHDMDTRAFGASRATLLERLAVDAPEYARVVERHGRLHGYLLGRHGHVREHLGPLVADSTETATLLIESALATHPDRRVLMDVPDDQRTFRDWLTQAGFAIERPFLRMHRGALAAPGQPSRVFAVAGPEFG